MVSLNLNPEKIQRLVKYHKIFQGIVALLSNHRLNKPINNIWAIFKYEGGVTVNDKEIIIYPNRIVDNDNRMSKTSTEEEQMVADVITSIVESVPENKLDVPLYLENIIHNEFPKTYKEFESVLKIFVDGPHGDPLRRFFNT